MDKDEIFQQWIARGFEELDSAECLSIYRHPTPDETICYLCQQSAEKYLKAFLFYNDIEPPNTHDLKRLLLLCQQKKSEFSTLESNAYILTRYGVMPRYPNELGITEEDMKSALANAKAVKEFVMKIFEDIFNSGNNNQ